MQMEEFYLCTDHQPLRWILSLADGPNRLVRWPFILTGHSFKVHSSEVPIAPLPMPYFGFQRMGKALFLQDLNANCLKVTAAEGPANPTCETAGVDHELIEDLQGVPTSDGQVTWPVHVAE